LKPIISFPHSLSEKYGHKSIGFSTVWKCSRSWGWDIYKNLHDVLSTRVLTQNQFVPSPRIRL
jgi:hypothetical protein